MGVSDISMEVVGNRKEMYMEGERLSKKFGSYATIKDSDYISFLDAVRSLGYRVVTLGAVVEIDGGRVTLNQSGNGFKLVGDTSLCGRFLQEHKIRKAEKDARKKGRRTKRQVKANGEIALEIA